MLVLSRKPGEQVVIDGGIVITVTAVSGGKVRIGIEAPKSVPVFRSELVDDPEAVAFQRHWMKADRQMAAAQTADNGAVLSEIGVERPTLSTYSPAGNRQRRRQRIPR